MDKNAYKQIDEAIDKYCEMWKEEGKKQYAKMQPKSNKK